MGTRLTDGEIGCFSHYPLSQMHLHRPTYLHVLEDDCLMSKRTAHFLDRVIAGGWLDTVDILFIESTLPNGFRIWRDARATYAQSITRAADGSTIDVRFGDMTYIGWMTSYLVHPRSIVANAGLRNWKTAIQTARPRHQEFRRDRQTAGEIAVSFHQLRSAGSVFLNRAA
jgi:hypothetical protein